MNLIKNIPIPVCGVILALLSLGNLTQEIHPMLKYIFGGVGIIFLILIILKVIFYTADVKKDFENPVILSNSGTFSMSLMILSTYIIQFSPAAAYGVWICGIALHILLMIYFTYHFIVHNFNLSDVYPSYWIVFVGITMGAITSPVHGAGEIGFVFFTIGFISMIVTLPIIIYRYIRYREIPDANKPLICIFTALFSILIVGYLNSSPKISVEFVTVLYMLACIFYIFALIKAIEYRNMDFYPSFAAFTFPFVISATASHSVFEKIAFNSILNGIAKIETAVAIILVLYVLFRYVKFLKIVGSRN